MKHIIFKINGVKYGVEISTVKSIIKYQKITSVPLSPPEHLGVTNIRGDIWPIFDIGFMLKKDHLAITESSKILLLENKVKGFLIDDVESIKEIEPEKIKTTELYGIKQDIANIDDDIVVILKEDYLLEI